MIADALRIASVVLMLTAFVLGIVVDHRRKTDRGLIYHLGRAAAAAGIPSAVVLLFGAFRPSILCQVPGLELPIVFGGLSLLYVSLKATLTQDRKARPN
jgi:hypothetical protein